MRQRDAEIFDVFRKVPAQGDSLRWGIYVVFLGDTVIVSEPRGIIHAGAYVERWHVKRPDGLVGQTVRIKGLPSGTTDVLVRVERSDGTAQWTRLPPANPAFVLEAS